MEDIVNKPHNNLFQKTWSNIQQAKNLFKNLLPQEIVKIIDLDTLTLSDDSFIDENLKAFHSDMLYHVRLKTGKKLYLYLLMEHKSSFDRFAPLQLLRYMINIWDKHKKSALLPMIIPMVLYHGKTKWTIGCDSLSMFEVPDPRLKDFQILQKDTGLEQLWGLLKYIFSVSEKTVEELAKIIDWIAPQTSNGEPIEEISL